MGNCAGSDDSKNNTQVTKELVQDKAVDASVRKLLFLGSGGSGKSTLFKQLRTIHGDGFQEKDRQSYKEHIFTQVIEQMKILVLAFSELKEDGEDKFENLKLSEEGEAAAEFMESASGDMELNEELVGAIETLWKEEAIKATFGERAKLKVDDSSEYFFEQVRRIAPKDYMPNDKDILMVRHRTTGVVEQKFTLDRITFHIFDVGGQRSERKKWIHCFEHVTAIIFVASLAAYNEIMYEDEQCNAMIDSIELFNETCNLEWFTKTSIILFLNKQDEFAKRIQRFPLTDCFPEYQGTNDYDGGVAYIKEKFESQNANPNTKQVYVHVTLATDKNNVARVFADVQHIVINNSLVIGGLM